MGEGVGTAIQHFAADADILLGLVGRAAAHEDLVVRLEHETGLAVNNEAVLQPEAEQFAGFTAGGGTLRVLDAAGYVYTDHRSGFLQATGTDDQIFQRHVVGVGIGTRQGHLAENLYVTQILQVVDAGHVEHIVLLEGYIGNGTGHQGLDINLQDFTGLVGAFPVEDGTTGKGFVQQTVGLGYQFAHGIQAAAQFVDARTGHGTADFQLVFETVQNGVGGNHVTVLQGKDAEIGILHGLYLVFLSVLADDAQGLGVGVAAESAGVFQQSAQGFVFLQFVAHGAFHVAAHFHQGFVGRNDDDIAFLQADIVVGLSFQDKLIDIDGSNLLAVTN